MTVRAWFTTTRQNHVMFSPESDIGTIEAAMLYAEAQGCSTHMELDPNHAPLSLSFLRMADNIEPQSWTSYFSDGIVVFSFADSRDAVSIRLLLPN